MLKNKTYNRKKIVTVFFGCALLMLALIGRLVYLMVFCSEHYTEMANELHERERSIKAARGRIIDANGTVIADNKTVCTVSVIHNQIKDADKIVEVLSAELGLSEEYVRKRVEKYSSIEKIKSNVDKEVGDKIRSYNLDGVKVDEDYKRYYPYDSLASKVLGFTGADNQGIIGLEVKYEEYLKGESGTILTVTDARGVEIDEAGEERVEPVAGKDLYISLDMNIQSYATQLAKQVMETKQAESVSIIVMNPQNGEVMAMVDVPEFDLNNPYTLPETVLSSALSAKESAAFGTAESTSSGTAETTFSGTVETTTQSTAESAASGTAETTTQSTVETTTQSAKESAASGTVETTTQSTAESTASGTAETTLSAEETQELLNQMWRNGCISDTYEPGSTFKIITAAAGLEAGVVTTEDSFSCPGFIMVEDRKIRCHKTAGHGSQSFVEATMNSCKQVFG